MPNARPRNFSAPSLLKPPDLPLGILRPARHSPPMRLPLFSTSVRAGFPSPADDYVSDHLDLNEHLIAHKDATFYVRAKGNSMVGAGIQDGDLLVVDRSATPSHRLVVIAVVDGEFTVKRLHKRAGRIKLLSENPEYPPIEFSDGQELQIWGVVTYVIHGLMR